jgi:hypothetical protein
MKKSLTELMRDAKITWSEKAKKSGVKVSLMCPFCSLWSESLTVLGAHSASESILRSKFGEHMKAEHPKLIDDQD